MPINCYPDHSTLLAQAFMQAPVGMALVSLDGRWLKANAALCKRIGYTEDELIGKTFMDTVPQNDAAEDIAPLRELLSGLADECRIAQHVLHKQGYPIRMELSVSLIRSDDGTPVCLAARTADQTGHESAEEQRQQQKLHEVETMFRLISDNSQDIISLLTPDRITRFVSPAVRTLLGYEPEEVIGTRSPDFYHPGDLADLQNRGLFRDGDSDRFTLRVKHKLGHYVWFETTINCIRDELGDVQYYFGVGRDITERKQAEEELRRSEERYRYLVENSPDGVLIGRNDKILYLNESALTLLGGKGDADREQIMQNPWDRIPPEYRQTIKERVLQVERGEATDFVEMRYVRLDGDVVDVDLMSMPTEFQGEPAIHTIMRDVTERKKTQELLRNSEKLSVAGQLAAGIAHEIRNPLTAIKGFFHLMRTGLTKPEFFEIITAEFDRIELIVSELLVLSKPQAVEFSRKNLVVMLKHVATLLETQAHLSNVEIAIDFDKDDLPIYGDENQLKQVFINLLKNSIEAMPRGGEITIRAVKEGQEKVIRIADQGEGIPREQLARIGQPFYTTKRSGTGLGMMVSIKIIENHGGRFYIESEPGQGTVCTIRLPSP